MKFIQNNYNPKKSKQEYTTIIKHINNALGNKLQDTINRPSPDICFLINMRSISL